VAAYEVLLLNTAIPQIQAAQAGDTYVVPRDIAINATAIISANSATDALRITQTGAGNALVVEDSANPDATPFVVTAAGDVGIGTSSPDQKLQIAGGAGSAWLHATNTANSDGTYVGTASSGEMNLYQAGIFPIVFHTASTLRMTLDSSGNLGIGTSSPNNKLTVQADATGAAFADNGVAQIIARGNTNTAKRLGLGIDTTNNVGVIQAQLVGTGNYPLALNPAGGDVGIGTTSPAYKLDVSGQVRALESGTGSGDGGLIGSTGSANGNAGVLFQTNATSRWNLTTQGTGGANLRFYNYALASTVATFDSSGNLGLGVTPTTIVGASGVNGQGFQTTSLTISAYAGTDQTYFATNAYTASYTGGWTYRVTAAATRYDQSSGSHIWYNAPSGTAGNAISFTQAMTLDASGKLGVGTTSPSALLDVNSGGVTAYASPAANFFRNHGAQAYSNLGGLQLYWNTSNGSGESEIVYGNLSTSYLRFIQNNAGSFTERARITSDGNLSLGGTADRATTIGTKALNIFDGTAPVGTLANGISLYSSSGEAYVMDAAGNATLFSPHDSETNEWIFKSKHTPSGKVLKIDVEKMLRFINDHFGLDAIHEFTEE